MAERSYPYKAWVVMPAFTVKEVELVRERWTKYDATVTGKSYYLNELHPTREAALAWAEQDLVRQQEALNKKQVTLTKKRDTLAKEKAKA